ncbi:MAG: shikimate kinase [Nitrosospira sp.]|nr:shikimate kinase [Nitrosospira sp.]
MKSTELIEMALKKNLTQERVVGNIYLVGMMGAGKTTIGKLLAECLDKKFIDSDREIQKSTGVTIPVIFEIEGEAGFRKRETEILRELVKIKKIVLATGGGVVLNPENCELLRHSGTVIYLKTSVHDLWQRTRYDKNRPLLQTEDPKEQLEKLYAQRDSLYSNIAHIIVSSGNHSASQCTQLLIQKLTEFTCGTDYES